jgi:hypothetical protein
MTRWTFCVPILPARDVPVAQARYRDVLGLGVNWIWRDDFGTGVPAEAQPPEFTFSEEAHA